MTPGQGSSPDSALAEAARALASGDAASSEAQCRAVLAASPDHPRALLILGNSLGRRGALAEAAEVLARAVERAPGNPDAHYALGMALTGLGRLPDAEAAYRAALGLAPRHGHAYTNLGVVLREMGALAVAIACFREAVAIDGGSLEALGNLAAALFEVDRAAEALVVVDRIDELAPDLPVNVLLKARILRALSRPDEALEPLRRLVEQHPRQVEPLYLLGRAQMDVGQGEAAIATFSRGPAEGPQGARFANAAGAALTMAGRLEEAGMAFERALSIDPGHAQAWLQLTAVKRFAADDPAVAAMEEVLGRPGQPDKSRIELHFALGRALEGAEAYDRAFAHYQAGNAAMHAQLGSDIGGVVATHEALRERFADPSDLSAGIEAGRRDPTPIFIVGMPRSGTTLVEQILASHPEVTAAGELKYLDDATLAVVQPFPQGLAQLDRDGLAAIAGRYRERLARISDGAPFVTDKMPVNHEKLGLIAAALPDAPIIHLNRGPMDTCLSCYQTLFAAGQRFSYDLTELGQYYRLYAALMEHWRRVLPAGRMLEVDYESLVAEPEPQIRALLAHCGLSWSDSCLSFHETSRPVRTASAAQVRRPLYRSSVERWRRYESHLGPLINALGEDD